MNTIWILGIVLLGLVGAILVKFTLRSEYANDVSNVIASEGRENTRSHYLHAAKK